MKQLRPDLQAIRGWLGWVHLLVCNDQITLIDSGFVGDFRRIRRAMAALGRKPQDLKAVLLTHGHLDHTANAARLRAWSGAKVYASAGDELHIAGRYPYKGLARICGALEFLGRKLVRYHPPQIDVWIRNGDTLPFWGGLQAVSLPGHTNGHTGFYSTAKRVLFAGDTFSAHFGIALPPAIFNTNTLRARESLKKVAWFDVDLIIPTHYFRLNKRIVGRVRQRAEAG